MGAWGLGLFESDHDADMTSDLESELGIRKLEEEALARAKVDDSLKKAYARKAGPHVKDLTDLIFLSIHASQCSSDATIALVRDHLDSGVLAKKIAAMDARDQSDPSDFKGYSRKGYEYVLLGACAMTLGCTLPASFKTGLKAKYKSVGLMRDALLEMKKAFCGPEGFKDSVPYVFEVPEGERSTGNDQLYPGSMLLNVQAPGNPFQTPDMMKSMEGIVEKLRRETGWPGVMTTGQMGGSDKAAAPKKEYGVNVCGGCGTDKGENGEVLSGCGKCKKQRYCGRECQKKHWKQHKTACAAAAKS